MPRTVALTIGTACAVTAVMAAQEQPALRANPALPPVTIPADNPQTEAKVALGAQLFFDPRLSADGTISCACHDSGKAWANHDPVDTCRMDRRRRWLT